MRFQPGTATCCALRRMLSNFRPESVQPSTAVSHVLVPEIDLT